MKNDLSNNASLQKEYSDLRTSYTQLKVKFDSINRKKEVPKTSRAVSNNLKQKSHENIAFENLVRFFEDVVKERTTPFRFDNENPTRTSQNKTPCTKPIMLAPGMYFLGKEPKIKKEKISKRFSQFINYSLQKKNQFFKKVVNTKQPFSTKVTNSNV